MKRQHPILSPVAIIGTLLLLLGLGIGLYTTGGRAFSPGELSAVGTIGQNLNGYASHAGFSEDCGQCHAPFQGIEASRCENCHVTIGEQRVAGTGLHGRLQTADCAACHSEHQGPEVRSAVLALERFSSTDHAVLFPLIGTHATLECESCHINEQFVGTPSDCVGCHAEPDLHKGLLGTDCASCHTADAWRPAALMAHQFELDHGDEGQIACVTCHTTTFNEFTCVECHSAAEIDDEHDELNITPLELADCASCHPTGTKDEAERIVGER
jgi:hypothetical protein